MFNLGELLWPKCCGTLLEWHPEVMVCRREVGENLECHEGMAVQMHEMEVPWRTHGWLTSHTQAGCISLNVENGEVLDQRAM